MTQAVTDRLGLAPYGDGDAVVGNFLLYPRRIVLEVLTRLLQNEKLFNTLDTPGRDEDRNPFLLRLTADGGVAPNSRVILADFGSEHLTKADMRPRLVVNRGTGRFLNSGFAQQRMVAPGVREYVDLFETGLTIRCVGRTKLESENLALVVVAALWFSRHEIRKRANLHAIGPLAVSETSAEESDVEVAQYVTLVTCEMTQTVAWKTQPIDSVVLEQVCVTVEV